MALKEEGNRLFKVISPAKKILDNNVTLFYSGGRRESREGSVLAESVDVPAANGGPRERKRILGHTGQQGLAEFRHQYDLFHDVFWIKFQQLAKKSLILSLLPKD